MLNNDLKQESYTRGKRNVKYVNLMKSCYCCHFPNATNIFQLISITLTVVPTHFMQYVRHWLKWGQFVWWTSTILTSPCSSSHYTNKHLGHQSHYGETAPLILTIASRNGIVMYGHSGTQQFSPANILFGASCVGEKSHSFLDVQGNRDRPHIKDGNLPIIWWIFKYCNWIQR